jgi:hypothetical protein
VTTAVNHDRRRRDFDGGDHDRCAGAVDDDADHDDHCAVEETSTLTTTTPGTSSTTPTATTTAPSCGTLLRRSSKESRTSRSWGWRDGEEAVELVRLSHPRSW